MIIDTDPGVDDSWALLLALRSPELEVVGVTSLFGNVRTKMATRNALYLLEKFGRPEVPVVEGSLVGVASSHAPPSPPSSLDTVPPFSTRGGCGHASLSAWPSFAVSGMCRGSRSPEASLLFFFIAAATVCSSFLHL